MSRQLQYIGASVLLCLLLVQGAVAQISGRVVDAQTNEPLPGVTVLATGDRSEKGVVTDGDGQYHLRGLVPGSYNLEARYVGFRPGRVAVTVVSGHGEEVNFQLQAVAYDLDEVIVSATRSTTPLSAVSGAVSILGQEAIEQQSLVTEGMGEILGNAVPGLSIGTQSMSNNGQGLRGRNVVVLIDGVPQSTLRNVQRDFATIDPSMVERVEVLRGATAIYGDGATGGVINIITRRPVAGRREFRTDVSMNGALSAFGDGIGGRFEQSVSGSEGVVRYLVSTAVARTGSMYDAEGDLIPPDPHGQGGLSDARSIDVLARAGVELRGKRILFGLNHYDTRQDTRYTADPTVTDGKARARAGLQQEIPQGTRNTVASLDYHQVSLLGSRLHTQLYLRDYYTVFRPFDRRNRKEHISQSFVDSEKLGARLEVETPFLRKLEAQLLWGADYTYENTSQPVYVMDPEVYDASGGLEFVRTGERTWVPPLQPHSLGLFAQVSLRPFPLLRLQGGLRQERVQMHVDDFTTLAGNAVTGGDLDYDPLLWNVGGVLDFSKALNVYASYAQGFSLADIGRILRAAAPGFSVGGNSLPAPIVDHYEAGFRGGLDRVGYSVSVFTSRSDLGTRLRQDATGALVIDPAPERVYGFESTLDLKPASRWSLGGTLSWTEGESYDAKRDSWHPLDGYRIAPLKLTGYLEHRLRRGWTNRVQVLHSGARDRAFEARLDPSKPAGYGEYPISAFTTVDLLSAIDAGPGTIRLGLKNVLNRHYFDLVSQLDRSDGFEYYSAARGASFSIGYSVRY